MTQQNNLQRAKEEAREQGQKDIDGSYLPDGMVAFYIEDLDEIVTSTVLQAVEDCITIVKTNQKGTFTDDGGNDCWYIDDLVKELQSLKQTKDV